MNGNEVLYVRSSKKKNKLNADDTSTNDDENDVWDDTLLIEAYDKAVHQAHSEVFKNLQSSSSKGKDILSKGGRKHQWKKGDHCRCVYSEDHEYYEAEIINIMDDIGMCIVKYLGYENEEKVPLDRLKQSKGEMYRNMQIQQALQDNLVKGDESIGKESETDVRSRSRKKKNNGKRGGKTKSKDSGFSANETNFNCYQNPSTTQMTIPPPPPPHMFANLSEDMCESEAMSAMLMAWYMSGYHTGYYQGLKVARRKY